jgi:prevent-host-death family protein
MSEVVNIHHAKTHLSKLIERVSSGEEITIARAGKPVARLVPFEPPAGERRPGSARGLIQIGEDFDAPLPDSIVNAFDS